MSSYIPNYSVSKGVRPYDFSKATISGALNYLLNGLLIIGFAIVAFLYTFYTSLVLAILVFLAVTGVGLLFILAGVRVWMHAKRRR